jgi:hypothetical protein
LAQLHLAGISHKKLARKVGDQTMVRNAVQGIEAMYAEYQKHGGKVHPNGALQTKPWGTKEFAAILPLGCLRDVSGMSAKSYSRDYRKLALASEHKLH